MKKVVLLLLLLVGLGVGITVSAYWASEITPGAAQDRTVTVEIGEAEGVNLDLFVSESAKLDGLLLVPDSEAGLNQSVDEEGFNNTYIVSHVFKVVWNPEDNKVILDGREGTLKVTIEGLVINQPDIDGVPQDSYNVLNNQMFDVKLYVVNDDNADYETVDKTELTSAGTDILTRLEEDEDDDVMVYILVVIDFKNEPVAKWEYDLVAGNDLVLSLKFAVTDEGQINEPSEPGGE